MADTNEKALAEEAERLVEEAEKASEEATRLWNEEWLKFPTISLDEEGTWHYWVVPEDTHVYATDWQVGEALARDTVAQMQHFPAGSSALRRILRQIDQDSLVAQGFLARLEDMLTNPAVYLESLEPGSVRAKLAGETPVPHWSAEEEDAGANGRA